MESNTPLALDDVDRRWKYRAGWPRLCHERVLTSPSPSNVSESDFQNLASRISTILDKHHIAYRGYSGRSFPTLAYRTQRRYLKNHPQEHFRVLVNCVFDPEQLKSHPDAWSMAVIEIHEIICEIPSLRGIGIELCDRVYEESLHLQHLPPHSERTREEWITQYRPQVLAKFESLPRLWQAMALMGLRASNEHTEDHTCVLWFDAIDTGNALWRALETELVSILPDNISVEIWQARNKLLCDDGDLSTCDVTKNLQIEDFAFPPKPGTSLGVLNDRLSSATLGGYVRVHTENGSTSEDRIYGVTNAHPLLKYDPTLERIEDRQLASGVRLNPQKTKYQMQSPAQKDIDGFIREGEANIGVYRAMKRRTEQEKEYLADDAAAIRRLDDRLSRQNAAVDLFTQQVETARQNRFIGDVTALVCGKCDHPSPEFNHSLGVDIALIDVTELVPCPEKVLAPIQDPRVSTEDDIWQSWDVDGLSKTNEKRPIEIVGKRGRSTRCTEGLLSCIMVDIHIDDSPLQKFSAWAVHAVDHDRLFSEPGDSGSFIFARNGSEYPGYKNVFKNATNDSGYLCVVGLQFGASVDAKLTYFMPFDAVVEKIEALTGGTVTWPIKRESASP